MAKRTLSSRVLLGTAGSAAVLVGAFFVSGFLPLLTCALLLLAAFLFGRTLSWVGERGRRSQGTAFTTPPPALEAPKLAEAAPGLGTSMLALHAKHEKQD